MSRYRKIICEPLHDGQVLGLTLSSPKGNVLDCEMIGELTEAVRCRAARPPVKALLFQGQGEHFCYGASVAEHQKEQAEGMLKALRGLLCSLIQAGRPCLALVRGCCLGGGLELAAFCHWIFASEEARFGQPEINLGVFPPVASLILPYRIGQSASDDLVLSGRLISAHEAWELGLVNSVSPQPEKDAGDFLAAHILPKSAASLHWAAKAARFAMHSAFMKDIEAVERIYLDSLMETEDANEGIQAFLEKRQPVWKDR